MEMVDSHTGIIGDTRREGDYTGVLFTHFTAFVGPGLCSNRIISIPRFYSIIQGHIPSNL